MSAWLSLNIPEDEQPEKFRVKGQFSRAGGPPGSKKDSSTGATGGGQTQNGTVNGPASSPREMTDNSGAKTKRTFRRPDPWFPPKTGSNKPPQRGGSCADQLPAHRVREEFLALVEKQTITLVNGQTGCGKSTQLPQFLLDGAAARIVCTQPRRLAATALARRVSEERGEKQPGAPGSSVGYFYEITHYHTLSYIITQSPCCCARQAPQPPIGHPPESRPLSPAIRPKLANVVGSPLKMASF